MSKTEFILHFNVKIKKSERNRLTRDNYCTPTNKISPNFKYIYVKEYEEYQRLKEKNNQPNNPRYSHVSTFPNDKLLDLEHYSDSYVKQHYEDCMKNFDLNMKYFNSLDSIKFNQALDSFIKEYNFLQIYDLNQLENVIGIYIIVLDNYKQVYIGMSKNIKKRIQRHWNNKKEFEKLIFR